MSEPIEHYLGEAYEAQQSGDLGRAEQLARDAISAHGESAPAFRLLAKVYQAQSKNQEAVDAYLRVLQLAPTLEDVLALGHSYLNGTDYESAAKCANRCLERYPNSAKAHLLLCSALIKMGRSELAEEHLASALASDPQHDEAVQIAFCQTSLGHFPEANAMLRTAVERDPGGARAYSLLMRSQRVTDKELPWVDRAKELLEDPRLPTKERIQLHYSVGKAFEDLGEFKESMGNYDEANRLSRQMRLGDEVFDPEEQTRSFDRFLHLFGSPHTLMSPDATQSELPILVVGMMRSGTTLMEQILSCHPKVAAAGERLFWGTRWPETIPQGQERPAQERVSRLGREYVDYLTSFGPASRRVIDKMPGNFLGLGLIHAAVPNARIIHMRRLPIDNCISIWATPNDVLPDGQHLKRALVHTYRGYMRVMEQWRKVVPADRLIEVDYEDLVSNPEQVIPRVVEFCGLEWDEACLRPERNQRLVATPSVWQVRQPLYRGSVERWRKFESCLGEFESLLDLRHPEA